jgi:hypothetical protein
MVCRFISKASLREDWAALACCIATCCMPGPPPPPPPYISICGAIMPPATPPIMGACCGGIPMSMPMPICGGGCAGANDCARRHASIERGQSVSGEHTRGSKRHLQARQRKGPRSLAPGRQVQTRWRQRPAQTPGPGRTPGSGARGSARAPPPVWPRRLARAAAPAAVAVSQPAAVLALVPELRSSERACAEEGQHCADQGSRQPQSIEKAGESSDRCAPHDRPDPTDSGCRGGAAEVGERTWLRLRRGCRCDEIVHHRGDRRLLRRRAAAASPASSSSSSPTPPAAPDRLLRRRATAASPDRIVSHLCLWCQVGPWRSNEQVTIRGHPSPPPLGATGADTAGVARSVAYPSTCRYVGAFRI